MTDTAYYYPAPYWAMREGGWIKSLLLFFDEVAILLPNYMHGRHTEADPTLAGPLEDLGLLRVLEPNDWVGVETANQLAEIVVELLTNGTFDDLPKGWLFRRVVAVQDRLQCGRELGKFSDRGTPDERPCSPERRRSLNPTPSNRSHHYPRHSRTTFSCCRSQARDGRSSSNQPSRCAIKDLIEIIIKGADAITRQRDQTGSLNPYHLIWSPFHLTTFYSSVPSIKMLIERTCVIFEASWLNSLRSKIPINEKPNCWSADKKPLTRPTTSNDLPAGGSARTWLHGL